MIDLLLNAALWFPAAIAIATAATATLVRRHARRGVARRVTILCALNLFYGCVVGIMASGHLVAVTIRAVEGTLSQGLTWFLYPLGLVLAIPAWWLAGSVGRLSRREAATRRRVLVLNLWLAIAFAALGPSAPLALPAALNVGYQLTSRPGAQRAIPIVAAAIYLVMFVISLVLGGEF